MSNYFGKQPSSRPIKYQALAYGGNATSVLSSTFTAQTNQIRVVSEVQGWLQISDASLASATVASSSLKINANGSADFFSVSPGMVAAFNSTSTSTGFVSITEMA